MKVMEKAESKKAVHIENLSVYYEQTPALAGIYLDVIEGEYLGIIGPNGGGKTTLLRSILGLIPKNTGTVQVFGEIPKKKEIPIGYVPQISAIDKWFPITVYEVVLSGRLKHGLSPMHRFSKDDKNAAEELLEKVGIFGLRKRRISELSGGEFQKMLIARALAINPTLLLLDEPTASVDAVSRQLIYKLLANLNKQITIILATHDLLAVSSEIKSLACLNGYLVYHGKPELSENVVNSLYGCPVDLIAHGVPHRVLKEHKGGV